MPQSRKRKRAKPMLQPVKKIVQPSLKLQYETPDFLKKVTHAYQDMIGDVLRRLVLVRKLISNEVTMGNTDASFETIALNFRKIAETIIYANLAGHNQEYDALYPPKKGDWQIKLIIERIKKINPNYYPEARRFVAKPDEHGDKKPTFIYGKNTFTEEDLIDMYNKCATWLHARKVYDPKPDFAATLELFKKWHDDICDQMQAHMVSLVNRTYVIFCHFTDDGARAVLFLNADEFNTQSGS